VAGGVNAADDCGWWLAAGRSQLVAGWSVVAFLDLLEIEFTSTQTTAGSHMSKCTSMHSSHIQIAGGSIDRKQVRYHQLNITKKVFFAKAFQKVAEVLSFPKKFT